MMSRLLIPLLTAGFGYGLVSLFCYSLFYPLKPYQTGFYIFQGLLPKRYTQWARALAQEISRQLLAESTLAQFMQSADLQGKALPFIEAHIDRFIRVKLKEEIPLLSMFINEEALQGIQKGITREVEDLIPALMTHITEEWKEKPVIENFIYQKLTEKDMASWIPVLAKRLEPEFRQLKRQAALAGLFIGIIQLYLAYHL